MKTRDTVSMCAIFESIEKCDIYCTIIMTFKRFDLSLLSKGSIQYYRESSLLMPSSLAEANLMVILQLSSTLHWNGASEWGIETRDRASSSMNERSMMLKSGTQKGCNFLIGIVWPGSQAQRRLGAHIGDACDQALKLTCVELLQCS